MVPHFVRVTFWAIIFLSVGGWAWLNGRPWKPGIRSLLMYFTLLLLLAKMME